MLISIAKGRAEYLVRTDVFEHPSYEFKFGENLHYIMLLIRNYSCHKVVKPWYDEIKDYNYANWRQSTGKIGHFTQVVWKASDKVGCAQVYSQNSKRLYTVCNYSPAGNYINRYNDNVLLPLNRTHN
ncbi:unnamed protein product [Medioppia subpectinata]|uniref:SCP domain-containing protein n=1 Tax=Medioppia subpectinata TaxID=1979941 RepID=A0A7R9PWM8_9ACAR|nr:unnamed protein product [Medioppia subpectinata]CAG2103951.1 unnamed protein product [Medioppia subpectinata]